LFISVKIFSKNTGTTCISVAIIIGPKKQKKSEQPAVSKGIKRLLSQQTEAFDQAGKCE